MLRFAIVAVRFSVSGLVVYRIPAGATTARLEDAGHAKLGDQVHVFWLDEVGRASPASKPITVEKAS